MSGETDPKYAQSPSGLVHRIRYEAAARYQPYPGFCLLTKCGREVTREPPWKTYKRPPKGKRCWRCF